MPGKTAKQRRFMGAELARKRSGKKTRTGMSEAKLREYARKRKRKKEFTMPHKTKSKAYRSTKAHPKPKSKMKAKAYKRK